MRVFGFIETPLQKNSVSSLINNAKSLLPFNQDAKPSVLAYQLLHQLWQDRALITVVTSLDSFTNMTITDLDSNKDPDTGGRFEFVVELMQLQFAKVMTTSNNNFRSGAIKSLASPVDNVGIADKPKSLITKALDGVVNFFQDDKAGLERIRKGTEAMNFL